MKFIFINHGFKGSNIENWFPWLKEKLDSDKIQVIIPQYPIDDDKHFYECWKKILDTYKDFDYLNEDSIIIGHSSGCAFSIKYILENNLNVDKLILVSGFNNYYSKDKLDFHNAVNKTFYVDEEELIKLKSNVNKIICIYGDNDPYIPQDEFHNLARVLSAKEIVIKNGGHLNKIAGYDHFEELLLEL